MRRNKKASVFFFCFFFRLLLFFPVMYETKGAVKTNYADLRAEGNKLSFFCCCFFALVASPRVQTVKTGKQEFE